MIISSGQSIPETTLRIGGADLIEAKRKARHSQSSQDELHVTVHTANRRRDRDAGRPARLAAVPAAAAGAVKRRAVVVVAAEGASAPPARGAAAGGSSRREFERRAGVRGAQGARGCRPL